VVIVSREEKKLQELKTKLGTPLSDHFIGVVGSFQDEEHSKEAHAKVIGALHGRHIDHVVSVLGFAALFPGGPTNSTGKDLQQGLDEGLFTAFHSSKAFLPGLKNHEGSTFTLVSGGLAHGLPDSKYWAGTIKNAAINALTLGLGAETKDDKVRVNCVCIHSGIAPFGGDKNQWGMPAIETRKLSPVFLALVRSKEKGKVVCVTDDVEKAIKSLAY